MTDPEQQTVYGITVMNSGLGKWLRAELEARNLTQSQAAELMGLPLQTLNDLIKKPKKKPSPLTLRKIADGLGVSLELIFDHMGHAAKTSTPQEGRVIPESVRGLSEPAYQQLLTMDADELNRYLMFLAERRQRRADEE